MEQSKAFSKAKIWPIIDKVIDNRVFANKKMTKKNLEKKIMIDFTYVL